MTGFLMGALGMMTLGGLPLPSLRLISLGVTRSTFGLGAAFGLGLGAAFGLGLGCGRVRGTPLPVRLRGAGVSSVFGPGAAGAFCGFSPALYLATTASAAWLYFSVSDIPAIAARFVFRPYFLYGFRLRTIKPLSNSVLVER